MTPTDDDLYDLAAQFHGDPVPAMRRALELWGSQLPRPIQDEYRATSAPRRWFDVHGGHANGGDVDSISEVPLVFLSCGFAVQLGGDGTQLVDVPVLGRSGLIRQRTQRGGDPVFVLKNWAVNESIQHRLRGWA